MAREPEIDEPVMAFKKANMNAIRRIMERAQAKSERDTKRGGPRLTARRGVLTRTLERAMADHGRTAAGRASIRMTAPDTGGRPYHFSMTTVTKGKRAARGSAASGGAGRATSKPAAGAASASKTAKRGARTKEGAHQAYTERDGAVERDTEPLDQTRGSGRERTAGRDIDPDEPGLEPSRTTQARERANEEERGAGPQASALDSSDGRLAAMAWLEDRRDDPGLSEGRSEASAQAYMENPEKVSRVRGTRSSFGTIGDTLEERMAFWDLVHDHESNHGGRTQSRLVLELPHEAGHRARHEIVRRFVSDFEDRDIPYWATIHEPTKRNDSRNYHAHVVFADRPMARTRHPETGEEVWDFKVTEIHVKKNRVRQTRHPYRQNRDPELRDRGWVRKSRARFAAIVNDVMVAEGLGVRYDPRSYKDMGLDVKPMENVSRILADNSKTRRFVALDPEWTRRLIDAEMREATLRRDETYQRLRAAEDRVQRAMRRSDSVQLANAGLPSGMRLQAGHELGAGVGELLARRMARLERDRLATQYADEATERALARVVEATGGSRTWTGRGAAEAMAAGVEPAALQELHQAAKEELAHFRAERDSRSRITGTVTNALRQAWESGARRRPGLDVGHASAEAAPQRPGPASGQHNSERSDAAGRSGHGPRAPSESPDAAKKNGVTAPQPAEQSAAQDLAARRTAPNEAQLRQSETPDADRLRSPVADSFSRFAEHLSHVPPANVGEVAGEILRQMAEGTRNAMALARSIEPPPTPKAQAAGIAPRTAPTPTPKPIAGSTPKQAPVEPPRQASLALSPPPQSSQSERRSARLTARVMSGPATPQVRKAPDGPAAEATRQVPTADGPQTPSREPTPASPAGKIDEAGRSPGPERRAAPRADPKPSGPEPSERAGDASPGATPDRDDEEAEARRKRRKAILAARARDRGRGR